MLEQLPQLSETASKAISNIKFDKVVVWDNGKEGGGTQGFLQNLAHSLPPMLHMMRDVGGVEMPEFLGKLVGDNARPRTEDQEREAVSTEAEGEGDEVTASRISDDDWSPRRARFDPREELVDLVGEFRVEVAATQSDPVREVTLAHFS